MMISRLYCRNRAWIESSVRQRGITVVTDDKELNFMFHFYVRKSFKNEDSRTLLLGFSMDSLLILNFPNSASVKVCCIFKVFKTQILIYSL